MAIELIDKIAPKNDGFTGMVDADQVIGGGAAGTLPDATVASSNITQHVGDIDHDSLLNTHNLTTDINHNTILNNHNLTTDIDHDQLTNFETTEHFLQSAISIPASQISDFDTEVANNSAVSDNTGKTTNATHTGDVTGSGALTLDKTSITGQGTVTVNDADFVLISDTSDTGNLKKVLASDFGGGVTDHSALNELDFASAGHTGFAAALTADENYVSDAQLVVIGNTSGTNSGDQTSIVGITGTMAQFDTAVTDGNFAYSGGAFHDGFSDFVGNEHIDHSGVSITAGSGLAGGGDLTTTRTLDLDINSLSIATIVAGDFVPFWDITATASNKKTTFANFEAALDHTGILNIGTNTHAQIDTHIADTTIHFTEGSIDHGSIAGRSDDDHTQYLLVDGTRAMTGALDMGTNAINNVTTLNATTIDLGTNTITDGNMTGDWDMNNTTLTNITSINGGTLSGNNSGDQDLSGLVPYTGATTDVDLGINNLAACEFNSATIYTDHVTNGDFATGDFTGWSNTTNWSAATNAAVTTNPSGAGDLQSDATIVANTLYKVTYTITQAETFSGIFFRTIVTMGGFTLATHEDAFGPTVFVHHIYARSADKLTFDPDDYYVTDPVVTIDDVKIETVGNSGFNTTDTNYLDRIISGDLLALDVDTVAGKAKFQMNLTPNEATLTIGDASNRWAEGHILDVYSENIYSKFSSNTRMYFTTSFNGRINFENDGVITYYFDKTGVTVNPGTAEADFLVLTSAGQMFKVDGSSNEVWIGDITSAANRWEVDRSGNTIHKDGRKANFGTGSDFSIQHNNTNAILNNTTGELQLQDNGTPRIRIDSTGMGFFNTAPIAKPTVASDTLANLYTAIRALGLVV